MWHRQASSAAGSSARTARMLAPIGAAVVLLAALVPLGAWWAAEQANRIATREESRQLANSVRKVLEGFRADQRSTAIWDDAVRNLRVAYDDAWAEGNVGVWMTQQFGNREIYVVDHEDRPVFAYVDGKRADNAAWEGRRRVLGPLLGEVRAAGAPPPAPAGGAGSGPVYAGRADLRQAARLAMIDGRPAAAGAIAVIPDFFTVQPPPGPEAVILSFRPVDDELLGGIAADLLVDGLAYAAPGAAPPPGPAVLPVGGDGAGLGWLSWTPKRPGDMLRAYVMPGATVVVAATLLLTAAGVRHARRVTGELLANEARARHLARHDPLTGLPNRAMLAERLERALGARPAGAAPRAAVLCLDLDRFKEVNDTFGHHAGDELLRQVAERVAAAVRDADLVARLGGDEFAVLLPDAGADADVAAVCQRLLACVREPFRVAGTAVRVGMSVGAARAPEDGTEPGELLRRADIALYRSKSQGRDGFSFFAREMDESLRLRREVEAELRDALARDELRLAYQPFYATDGRSLRGVEALLRWDHPTRGPMAPGFFVPIAEEGDLILPLGEWVLRRACQDAARWPGLTVAVNLSPQQVRSGAIADTVRRTLDAAGLEPGRLELEVTEGVLMDTSERTRRTLAELRALGVRVALDDFGTGYSSLSYLRRFDFDRLKIDRSFVHNLPAADGAAIVRAVVELGRALGMSVTAEGVETREQHRLLREMGCDEMQGFLFGRPAAAADIDRLVRARLAPEPALQSP
jgi:diguanylate cyclase (GGDEF)-like protein